MLENLPELACSILMEQYLTDLEVKTLRLVSKGLKFWIDTNLTALKPRTFSRSQELGLVKAFPNLEKLELRHYNHAAPQEYASEYMQLTALTKLTTLKLELEICCHHPTLIQGIEGLTGLMSSLQYEHAKALSNEALHALSCLVHLRELSLSGAISLAGKGLAALKDLPHFRSLDIRWGGRIPPEGLHTLAGLTQLTALDASYTAILGVTPPYLWSTSQAHGTLGNLSCPTGLQRLDLSHNISASQGLLRQLAQLSRLTALYIDTHYKFDTPPIEGSALLNLKELVVLGVAGWHIHLAPRTASHDSSGLAKMALTELHAPTWQHEHHEVLLNAAFRGGKLCVLKIDGVCRSTASYPDNPDLWTQAGYQAPTLTRMEFCSCFRISLPALLAIPRLKCLKFSVCGRSNTFRALFSSSSGMHYYVDLTGHSETRCTVSRAELSHYVSSMTALETLQIHNSWTCCPGSVPVSAALESLSTLRTLVLPTNHPITREDVRHLAQLTRLQALDLSEHLGRAQWALMQAEDVRPLSALTGLTSLGLPSMRIHKPGFEAIRCLKSLRILKLDRCHFTNKGLLVLTGLTALRSLSLRACHNLTDKDLKAVVVPLSKQSLAQVDVEGCSRLTPLSLAVNMGVTCCKICRSPTWPETIATGLL